ncbi:hypothetical protein A4D02_33605 [Niastella koreensis]|uniref:AIG2 family protein n=3 Tax=Niastella koreensis TaxID=354356 RepID=G8TAG6_NIAKG|nr:hypothetical protein Niako_1765 [Niastella koreensis GR20-10]OQP45336.1 hypothetical protein A4D02_33605 [Niastella koreensis]
MTNLQDKVWYACYGSNILEERFLCYIKGGQPKGAKTTYEGCRNKTLPADNEDFYISSELYFAKESNNWDNGGVAFVRTLFEPQASTIGRIYLVTKGQLIDIARQETNTKTELTIDFDKAINDSSYILKRPSWYGNLLYLGRQNEYPIFTLTNENDLQPFTKPNKNYIKTISKGIKEAHNFDDKTIFEYLKTKGGIKDNYTDQELIEIINE